MTEDLDVNATGSSRRGEKDVPGAISAREDVAAYERISKIMRPVWSRRDSQTYGKTKKRLGSSDDEGFPEGAFHLST